MSDEIEMKDGIMSNLLNIFAKVSAIDKKDFSLNLSFMDFGIDSVLLSSIVEMLNTEFKINISLRELIIEYDTLEKLIKYIYQNSKAISSNQVESISCTNTNRSFDTNNEIIRETTAYNTYNKLDMVLSVIEQQKKAMENVFSKQIELMQGYIANNKSANVKDIKPKKIIKDHQIYVPTQKINLQKTKFNDSQIKKIDELCGIITKKTITSKQIAQKYRQYLADPDESAGFNLALKEMHYQLTINSACGSKFVDIDQNEYIDIAMGFGSLLLGHSPNFLINAARDELNRGLQLAPRHRLVGEVAEMLHTITGLDRFAFTATGTEAVMTSIKIARTYSGKNKIVVFSGGYHGHSDGTLVTVSDGSLQAIPIAPGISRGTISDTFVLEYNNISSLEFLKEMASEIAAVLVEPVQSRRPDLHPQAFLSELQRITRDYNILLILDEVITGFRCNIGGAKALFDLQPSLVIYGKAVCNGFPVGIVAGNKEIMNVCDGGLWNFNDNSYPSVKQTYFAGTFFKHPLTIAAAHSTLSHLLENGPKLQENLTINTNMLVNSLNLIFEKHRVPIKAANFSSLFKFFPKGKNPYLEIFYYLLLSKGLYTWEGKTCFLSSAHTDDDIKNILQIVEESVMEMIASKFYTDESSAIHIDEGFVSGVPDKIYYE
jgi:glutamate-1-semialdehyde aminotransferase/acyl carrier protein